ncbi:hypothetical protein [Sulfurovum sp.]|uniref:hypothetical protein n=1 Tax=Sulfurovum sp. TaxID=1969726 RepID=UPI0025F3A9D6|nr:hypothetical protein [Sulfurovum sp.]
MMGKRVLFTKVLLLFILLLSGCTSDRDESIYSKTLKISTNSWIGYAPLYYAKAKGYLKPLNIELIVNVSLAEAADIYLIGNADIVSATQHEYKQIKKSIPDTVPFILLDRSNGGDMILSNRSLDTIKKAKKIDAYLEIDSINADMLQDFIRQYDLNISRFNFINKDQAQIASLAPEQKKAMLIVTYAPYDVKLRKAGFSLLSSTRNTHELVVIDALCTRKTLLQRDKTRLMALKKVIDRSIKEIEADKKGSYDLVSGYLGDINSQDYLDAFKGIKWINHPDKDLLKCIEPLGYNKEYILP